MAKANTALFWNVKSHQILHFNFGKYDILRRSFLSSRLVNIYTAESTIKIIIGLKLIFLYLILIYRKTNFILSQNKELMTTNKFISQFKFDLCSYYVYVKN